MSDNQLVTKLQLAQKSFHLSLPSMNLFQIPEKIFMITNLLRLDLSNNNIEAIPSTVSNLVKLKHLWVNQNPLHTLPIEIAKCKALESLDLSHTKITTLPKDLALLHKLLEIKLDRCPLNDKLKAKHEEGITEVWKYLQRKVDRQNYKEEVFRRLRENIYVGEDPRVVMELTLSVFRNLADVDTKTLKLFVHNLNRIFPEKIDYVVPEIIRQRLDNIITDLDRRNELSEMTLKLKSRYPQVDLSKIAQLASTLSQTYAKDEIENIFQHKLLPEDFNDIELPAIAMSLTTIREKIEHQMERARLALFSKFKTVYGNSESLDELQASAMNFSQLFESYVDLRAFIRTSESYLPQSFKDFDAENIYNQFISNNKIE
jgi:hypothetical protein